MATIGQQLLQPESDWKRYDDSHANIKYNGVWDSNTSNSGSWNNTRHLSNNTTKSLKFKFKGTKLRIIVNTSGNRTTDAIVNIDGQDYTFSTKFTTSSSILPTYLAHEVTGLEDKIHDVEITDTTSNFLDIDAVDIDKNGELLSLPLGVGDALTSPENGWKRYDDSFPLIGREGAWTHEVSAPLLNGSAYHSVGTGGKIKICFKGTKFRIIAPYYTNKSTQVPVVIDGVTETFNQYGSLLYTRLVYEKQDLKDDVHYVEIKVPNDIGTGNIQIEAIDINEDGELIRYDYLTSDWSEPMKKYGVAWFGFDEPSGNVVDKLGNGYTGTVTGATRASGWNGEGYSLSFNGNGYVDFGRNLLNNNEFSIRLKLKINSYPISTPSMVFQNENRDVGTGLGHMLYLYQNKILSFEWLTSRSPFTISNFIASKPLELNRFYDILLTQRIYGSKQVLSMYIDEEYIGQSVSSIDFRLGGTNLMLGANGLTSYRYFLNGQIDDLQIYNKALSPSDFTQKRLVIKTTNDKNLVLSPTSTRVKEIPNTAEYIMLAQGGIVKEIDSAVDRPPINFTKTSTEYEIVTSNKTPLGKGRMFTTPIGTDFKTAMIEDNY
ncbi:LamG-like jellyroll fold domain-containing protein [Lysinibacillus sphaericus]|uniref:LamG-like jellyroll fold domain-containing protein n=1 Tax=Lysinibacillus sphaericus TaxID=1421 RepID=UPI001CC11265|nr:LamG-like jellyroll fold domain-containing protein [Lysinibacillus sphaericus]